MNFECHPSPTTIPETWSGVNSTGSLTKSEEHRISMLLRDDLIHNAIKGSTQPRVH